MTGIAVPPAVLGPHRRPSPAVRRLLRNDPDAAAGIAGSGRGGRVTAADIARADHISARSAGAPTTIGLGGSATLNIRDTLQPVIDAALRAAAAGTGVGALGIRYIDTPGIESAWEAPRVGEALRIVITAPESTVCAVATENGPGIRVETRRRLVASWNSGVDADRAHAMLNAALIALNPEETR
jgi:Pyruvate/2-oxoglutarate dehydrogenase complex, dihydrolipoamide acyltransferase (E2) component, and related enzymes